MPDVFFGQNELNDDVIVDVSATGDSTPRPLEAVKLPDAKARDNLRRKMLGQGLPEEVAREVARIVVDPTDARHGLDHLVRRRFPGGTAYLLMAEVFTPAISVNPVNPRETERRYYPVESGATTAPPLRLTAPADGTAILTINGESPDHIAHVLRQSAGDLRSIGNPELQDPIWLEGVREPLLLFVAQVNHQNGAPTETFTLAADGSSRAAWCQAFTGTDPVDAVYRWPKADMRSWNGHLGRILAVQTRSADEVTEDEKAAHRALVAPAAIVVRIEPVLGGMSVTALQSYRSMIGAIHVARPKLWGEGAENDEIATAALEALVDDAVITADERDYMAGMIPADDLARRGFSVFPDERAAFIMSVMNAARSVRSISRAYCGIRQQKRLGRTDRPNLAAELMLRAYRGHLGGPEASRKASLGPRSALQRALQLPAWRNGSFLVSRRPVEALRDAALQNLSENPGSLSKPALELGLMGGYWLILTRSLRRSTSKNDVVTEPDGILDRMMRTPRGIHQLYQAIEDGRRGTGEVRRVKADTAGSIDYLPTNKPVIVNDAWLRDEFVSKVSPTTGAASNSDLAAPVMIPRERLADLLRELRRDVYAVERHIGEMSGLRENGRSLVDAQGINPTEAEDLQTKLQQASMELYRWSRVRQQLLLDALPADDGEDLVTDGARA